MPTITYPQSSDDPTPKFSLTLVEGWQEAEIQGSKLSAVKYKGKDKFAPNIILDVLKDSPASSLEVAMSGVQGYLATLDQPKILTNEVGTIKERDWHIAEFIHRHKAVGDIIQMIATTVEKTADVTYVYRVTGTALSVEAKADFIDIRKMLISVTIT